jgi:hypothetical protein
MATTFHRHMTQRVAADPHWRVNCTAYAAAMLINDTTLGGLFGVTGENVRRWSDEPIPDSGSPGLNIKQIVNVARDRFKVNIADRTGNDWNALMHELSRGRRILAQIEYRSLGDYRLGQPGGDFPHALTLVLPTPNTIRLSDPLYSKTQDVPRSVVADAMADFAQTTGHARGYLWWAMTRPIPRTA